MTNVIALTLMAVVIVSVALAVAVVWVQVQISSRLQRTEHALVAVLRLLEARTGALPRELAEFMSAHPGGVHRG